MKYTLWFFMFCVAFWACTDFERDGILVEGSIARKETRTGGKGGTQYQFVMYYFTSPQKEDAKADTLQIEDTIKPKNIDEIIEGLTIDSRIGDFTSATVVVSKSTYQKYVEGDKLQLYYLKDDPQRIRLK